MRCELPNIGPRAEDGEMEQGLESWVIQREIVYTTSVQLTHRPRHKRQHKEGLRACSHVNTHHIA